MAISPNIVKKRTESVKTLRNSNVKNKKLHSDFKAKKLSTKKVKQNINTNMKTRQVKNDLTNEERKNTNLINKKLVKKGEVKTNTLNKSALHQFRKKNTHGFKKANVTKFNDHVDTNEKLKLQHEESTKKKNYKILNHVLKRKRSLNDDTFYDKYSVFTAQRSSKKRRKIDSTQESTDILNLNDLSKEHILQCIGAIFHLTEEQLKSKSLLFEGECYPIFMQVTCIRIPKTPRRQMRILLPHSIVSSNDEVALFVGDLQRGRRKDYEPTVEHYQDLLRKHNCTSINAVIPMNQVKTEYDQYELKRKLVGSYDHFLVDGKIAGHLSHLLGKEFYKRRKLPTSIRILSKDLKHEIEYALRKTSMQLHSYGDTHIVQIGHTSMTEEEISDNVLAACKHLSKNYPGGWANVRSVSIKTARSLALPIYVTLKNKNSVKIPIVQPPRPKAYRKVTDELSTFTKDVLVTVTPEGDVTLKRRKNEDQKKKKKE
ncbi:ribosomal L1 domain-containing protein 1-like isoform X1 [Colletes gigas]|uniref:ribosomal L1 domain-containing protein 1-like isoform X1 n=1 Tax=Colletes gigas TaxID=935657 RepID=UPI001C9AD7A6|nr:ribosomal L1 domain-containing protein 1-like isoform X1 [Colletes gigas]